MFSLRACNPIFNACAPVPAELRGLELELQVVVIHQIWVQGTKPGSCARVLNLDH